MAVADRLPRGAGEDAVAETLRVLGWAVEEPWRQRRDPPDLIATKPGVTRRIEVKTARIDRPRTRYRRPNEDVDFEFKASDWVAADIFVLCIHRGGAVTDCYVMRKDEAPVGPIVKVTRRTRFFLEEAQLRYPDWLQHLDRWDKLE